MTRRWTRMEIPRSTLGVALLGTMTVLSPEAMAQDTWAGDFYWPGTVDYVDAVHSHEDGLFIAGDFTQIGNIHTRGIARWDGDAWHSLGSGLNGSARAITRFEDELVVGGSFSEAGGIPAAGIAAWNGEAWHAFGAGLEHHVQAVVIFEGRLIAAMSPYPAIPDFQTICYWDGTEWLPLGQGIFGRVFALAVDGEQLYAGGDFCLEDGSVGNRVACWDGQSWSALGEGVNGRVYALVAQGGVLTAGGYFTEAGGQEADHVACWDGTSWSPLGSGVDNTVYSLCYRSGFLYVGGEFGWAGDVELNQIGCWDGANWSALGVGFDHPDGFYGTWALGFHEEQLFAGGRFNCSGDLRLSSIGAWDGAVWHPLGSGAGMDAFVSSLWSDGDRLIAGGEFTDAGGAPAAMMALWDGAAWSPFDPPLSPQAGYDDAVYAFTVYQDKLIVGGSFLAENGAVADYIAQWDGAAWSPLGDGLGGTACERGVRALAVYEGKLIAGGWFNEAGGAVVEHLAQWDGSCWTPLGGGVSGAWHNFVDALTVNQGDLIVGGGFNYAGDVEAHSIARWDGTEWHDMAGGVYGSVTIVHAFAEYAGRLYVGGQFYGAGDTPSRGIVAWNGLFWDQVGGGLDGSALAIAPYAGGIVVGGMFDAAGGTEAQAVARWDGSSWHRMGTGLWMPEGLAGPAAYAAVSHQESIFVGGRFWTAGDVPSYYIGRWDPAGQDVDRRVPWSTGPRPALRGANPWTSGMAFSVEVPTARSVHLSVHDLQGRWLATLLDRALGTGEHTVTWSGVDSRGRRMASGTYLLHLRAGDAAMTRKLLVIH